MANGIFINGKHYNLFIEGRRWFKTVRYDDKKYIPVHGQKYADKIESLDVDSPVFMLQNYKLPNLKQITFLRDNLSVGRNTLAATKVKYIEFPDEAKLDEQVLMKCHALKSVIFPMNMSTVPAAACMDASNLVSVKFGNNVRVFGIDCFRGCKKLELQIPRTVQRIEFGALKGAGNHELIIPESCEYCGAYAFSDMRHLKEVVIKNPQTKIEPTAFHGSMNIHTVQIGQNIYPAKIIHTALAIILNTEYVQGIKLGTYRHMGENIERYFACYDDENEDEHGVYDENRDNAIWLAKRYRNRYIARKRGGR